MTELDPWVYVYDVVEGDRVVFHIVPKSKIDDVEYRVNGGATFSVWVRPDIWFDRLFGTKFDDRLRETIEYMESKVMILNNTDRESATAPADRMRQKVRDMVAEYKLGGFREDYR